MVGYSDTSYTYGLFLDGVTSYENLTGQFNDGATVNLKDDPTVTVKEYEDYKMLFSDTITIQVNSVLNYCTSIFVENCISGVLISVLALSVVIMVSSPGRVKPKTVKLIFIVFSARHAALRKNLVGLE